MLAPLLLALALDRAHARDAASFDYGLVPRQIADGVYVLEGRKEDFSTANGGDIANTGFIVGTAGVIVIDTGSSRRYGEQMRAAIARITPLPVVLTINTHTTPTTFSATRPSRPTRSPPCPPPSPASRPKAAPSTTISTAWWATGCATPRWWCRAAVWPPDGR